MSHYARRPCDYSCVCTCVYVCVCAITKGREALEPPRCWGWCPSHTASGRRPCQSWGRLSGSLSTPRTSPSWRKGHLHEQWHYGNTVQKNKRRPWCIHTSLPRCSATKHEFKLRNAKNVTILKSLYSIWINICALLILYLKRYTVIFYSHLVVNRSKVWGHLEISLFKEKHSFFQWR